MLVAELTPYGQSVVSTHVTIDGIILLSEYLLNIDSLTNISSYTTLLDEDACGNISKSNGYVKVLDTSESVYQARTLLFYSLSGSTKNIIAGCSQSDPIVNKTLSALNIQVPVDLSCFTNGFIFSSIQSGYHTASDNIDGVVHIDDPSLDSDDIYSVYSKPQVDTLLSNKQSSLEAGDGISLSDNIVRTTGIPFGICDSTSTATKFTVTVPGIYKLEDGVTCMVKNGVVTSASGFTLNVNGLGAKPCYTNLAAATRDTTIFNVAYTMLFVYDSTRVSGGCWICYRGYDSNTNTVGYQLRTNSTVMNVSDTARYYKLYFTSANGNLWVPASVNSTNDATTARAVNQRPINPFGRIVYTSANTNYATGANLAATTIWDQYNLALGYSFNVNGGTLALTAEKPVYVKCAPQTDGSAIIDSTNPTVQDLPTSNDGKIYIFLGTATSATAVELFQNHPVYYHDGNGIKLWSGVVLPSKISDLTNDSGFITEEDIPTNISAFNNDAGYLTSFTETDPTVPSWAKQTTKPAYNLDEVADGSTRKLSNYVPTTRKVNNKALSSDVTLTLDDIADGTTRTIPIVNNSTITIKKNSDDTGDSFTTNTASGKTINLSLSTVASSGSYNDLSNKPTIPTVNNATLTIQKNGTTVKTFTANASSNVTANITVPTTVAELSDAGSYATTSSLSSLVASAQYNSITKKIEFYNSSSTKLNTDIDASAFIKDGMVDTVEVTGGNLVITFNTDAGKEDIEIPISDIFDANNYYTKTQIDSLIPTVNNAKLTIKKNASDTGTEFTANASTNVTCNLGLATVATSGSYADLLNKPTIPTVNDTAITIKKNASDTGDSFTTNTATAKTINLGLSTVATSGSYNDLSNKPTIPTVNNSTITIKKNGDDTGDSFTTNASSGKTINLGLATVATSGSYNDLSNKPTIPTVNNATLTIQKNGTTVKTFTANASSDVTANITVPLESISVDGATQTITNKNVDLHIPDDIYSSDFICSMTRTNVSGSGNLTLSGTVGPFPVSGTPMPAGTYRVRIRMRSTTSSYSLTVNFCGSYTLTSSNGVIDDIRLVTLSSASTFSASVTQVNANTYIKVSIYEHDVIVTDVGDAAVTNDYNDLDNIPNGTLIIQRNGSNVASFSASATSNVTANITVPTTTSQLTNNSGFITSADLPTNVSQLNNDVGYITGYTETDPTVPSWAKESTKPLYNLDEVSDGTARKLSDYVRLATTNRENQTINSSITIHPKHNSYNNYREYTFDGTDFSARTSMELKSWEYDGNNVERSILVSIRPEPYAGVLDNSTYTPAEYIRISTSDGQISNDLLWITEEFDANGSKYNIYGAAVANYSSVPNTSLVDGRLTTVDYVNAKSKLSNWYAVCSTGASTKAKKITIPGFTLETGAKVTVKFTATNSASAPTLTVNDGTTDSEAKPICYRGTSAVTSGNYYRWQANDVVDLVYDGTNWIIIGWQTYSYYSTVSSYATYVGSGSSTYVAYSNNGSAGSRALLPRTDATTTDWVDLGSTAKRWKTLYLTDSINDGTNTFALPDKSGTLALESKTYTVSRSPVESNLIQSGKDYRQPKPSGSDFSYNPKWSGEDVSIGISQYIDLSENSRIYVYVQDTTYVGSIAFLSAQGASTYSAYPLYFRGDNSAHNATVPGGSILRLTFREDAFYNDFYDLADFGVEHEPIVRVGKLPHNQQTDNYNGALVGVRSDNGKLDKILNVSKSGSTVTETLTSLHTSSPIYVSFMGECFSAHPRVPFGLILNLDYIYNAGDSPKYENIPFLYIENGSIVSLSSSIQSHIVTSSTGKRYFHVNDAPVYLSYRPIGPNSNVYISIGGPYSGYTGAQGTTLLGFLPSNESEAGLLRLVNCFTPKNYADQALNTYNANFSSTAYMLVQGNSSGGSAGLVCGTELNSYVDIKPGTNKNNALSLGSTTYRWKNIYVNGSSSSYYLEIGNDTSGSTHSTNQPVIRPTTNGVGYLGTSDYHLNTAYINNLYVTTSGTSIASYIESQISSKISGTGVGSICLLNVSITNSSSSVATVSRGSLLNSNSNLSVSTLSIASPHLVAASSATPSSYNNTVGCYYSGSASGTSGAYKLLSSLYVPANTTKRYIVLAIRVS